MLKIYNTFSRKKETFKPLTKGKAGLYVCGLTVYNYGHIGNYKSITSADILTRYLKYLGYKVKKVVNITDVDDKTIKNSIQEGKESKEYTKKYTEGFFEDEKSLNILPADVYPKATENIDGMIKLIQRLLDSGYAYKADDGIYFNIKKFKNYGKLSKIKKENLKQGERVKKDEYDKENVQDFALWKFYDKEDGNVFWETPFGKGRPGWHIECSVMSVKNLGQPFDIHCGGVDLIFPHHENEIAQSEAANNKRFANYWVHSEWLMVDGKKMSKSLGNYYTLRDIIKLGYDPLSLRYFYLSGEYRSQVNFTFDNLKNAGNSLLRLRNIISELKDDKKINEEYSKEFEEAMNDDLNTPKALQVLWKLVRDKKAIGKVKAIKKIDSVFGLDLFKTGEKKDDIPKRIKELAEKREEARKNKDWKSADKLRDEIKNAGYSVDDTDSGVKIRRL